METANIGTEQEALAVYDKCLSKAFEDLSKDELSMVYPEIPGKPSIEPNKVVAFIEEVEKFTKHLLRAQLETDHTISPPAVKYLQDILEKK